MRTCIVSPVVWSNVFVATNCKGPHSVVQFPHAIMWYLYLRMIEHCWCNMWRHPSCGKKDTFQEKSHNWKSLGTKRKYLCSTLKLKPKHWDYSNHVIIMVVTSKIFVQWVTLYYTEADRRSLFTITCVMIFLSFM